MNNATLKVISYVCLLIFFYLFLYNLIIGATTLPLEGDSIHYHIPVANYYLTGEIMNPPDKEMIIRWYPSASESILAVFILLHIPLNLYNVFATLVLFGVCYMFGNNFLKNKYIAIIFATSCVCVHGILRLQHTQNIDIWLAIFFILSVYLLYKPEKNWRYFLKLGICLGMVIGSKYSGPMFALVIVIVFSKTILKNISFQRFVIFMLPILLIGISWYIRNLLLTGSPIYPQGLLFFKGYHGWEGNDATFMRFPVWKAFIFYPNFTFSAFMSEYMMWSINFIVLPLATLFIFTNRIKLSKIKPLWFNNISRILLLTILSYAVYFILPAEQQYKHILLGIRYSFGPFILAILINFMLAMHFNKLKLLCYLVIANMIILPPLNYHPKILLIYLPIVIFGYYIGNNMNSFKSIKKRIYGKFEYK